MKLKDKVTVVAGASCRQGLSSAVPEAFAAEGSNLVLTYLNSPKEEMEAFARSLEEKNGVKVCLVQGDVSTEEVAKKLIQTAIDEFGHVDVLINNTGISKEYLVQDMPFDVWKRMLAVHLDSMFLTCKYAIPHMIEQRFGRIINIASQIGVKGGVQLSHYGCAKAGMIGFTKCIARELGQYGVTANCIALGPVNTKMLDKADEEWKKNKKAELVIPRFGETNEVTPTAILLASSPDGNIYTGQTFHPNCGDVMP